MALDHPAPTQPSSKLANRLLLVFVPAVVAVVATTITMRLSPAMYESTATLIVVPQRVPADYAPSLSTNRIEDRFGTIRAQVLSRTKSEGIIQDLNLYASDRGDTIMEDLVERLRRETTITVLPPAGGEGTSQSFQVAFRNDNPRMAMKVAEQLTALIINETYRDRENLAENTASFLDGQIEELKETVAKKDQANRTATRAGNVRRGDVLELEVLEDTLKTLLQRQQQARIASNLERRQVGEQFMVLDPPRLPSVPVGAPGWHVTAIGGLGGLGAGLCLALGASWRDGRRRRPAVPVDPRA